MSRNVLVQQPLAGFAQADTRSPREGTVDPGAYPLLELLEKHPDKDSDYARIAVPALSGGDTWVCVRWKTTTYASVLGDRPDFSKDPQAIPESALTKQIPTFAPYQYGLKDARYPRPLPGVKLPLAPPLLNNCCTFVEAIVIGAWMDTFGAAFKWSADRHNQMMITSLADSFSPVTAVIQAELALGVANPDSPPGPWTLMQGWQAPKRDGTLAGHTLLIVDYDADSDRVLTLESNMYHHLNGPGWRIFGNLRDLPKPPKNWWTRKDAPTWTGMKKTYVNRRQALLRVHTRSISGLG